MIAVADEQHPDLVLNCPEVVHSYVQGFHEPVSVAVLKILNNSSMQIRHGEPDYAVGTSTRRASGRNRSAPSRSRCSNT